MEQAEFHAIIQQLGVPESAGSPIEDHLLALTPAGELSAIALAACIARIEEAGPPLIALLERATAGEYLSVADEILLFRGLHVLGAARYHPACLPVLRFLALPTERIEYFLSDAITETLPKIIIGVFNGDHIPLFGLTANRNADIWVRGASLRALAFLTWAGQVDHLATCNFLQRFHDERLAEDGEPPWFDWQRSIAVLGLREFAPLVHAARASGRIPNQIDDPEDFERILAQAEQEPANPARFKKEGACYIEDIMHELRWTVRKPEPDEPENAPAHLIFPNGKYMPAVNPTRNVGRNDPCPCGSGKKYKKCCLQG